MARLIERLQVRHLYPILPIALAAVVAAAPIKDNSFLWHVRAGTVQVDLGRVLTADPFSYVAAGEAWRTQSWLVELLYAFAESTFGGVGWAKALLGVVTVGILIGVGLMAYENARSTFSTAMWLLVLVWLLVPYIQPRPVVFSYLLLASVAVSLALGDRVQWVIVPIVWVWAGIHGSWLIGVGLVMLVAISRRSYRLAGVGAVAAMATAATAHGVGAWSIIYTFARSSSALDYVEEWRVPDFGSIVQAPYVFILIGLLVAAIVGRLTLSDLWVVVPFMVLGLMSRRMVPVAALVLLPFAARSVRVALPVGTKKTHALPWIVLSTVCVVVAVAYLLPSSELDRGRFPSDEAVAALGTGRFFHDDAVGGYLIYRDGPDRMVYVDDRVELYGEARFVEFLAARDGSYVGVFDRLGLTVALVRPDWALRTALIADGWYVTYTDDFFEVLVEPKAK